MIACDTCNEWYHFSCIGLRCAPAFIARTLRSASPDVARCGREEEVGPDDTYECDACADHRTTGTMDQVSCRFEFDSAA
jgi:hypothetical protein